MASERDRNADRLAEVEEKLLDVLGSDFDHYRQSLEARRRIKWARQWIVLAASHEEQDGRAHFAEAARHLRQAIKAIDKADP